MHSVARANADSDYCLHHLSDADLLAGTRGQVGRSNQVLADLLAHLAEVEARGLYRTRACSSLYTYCIYELRMSEDAAWRRAHAARILRRFPLLFDPIAAGEIHLTAVLMLGPHLTETNHVEVLARAKHRTKKEVAALVRQLDPLPDVPARIEPLGPRTSETSPLSNPTFGEWSASLCGPVRELAPGERPKDWVETRTGDTLGVELGAKHDAQRIPDAQNSSDRGELDFAHDARDARDARECVSSRSDTAACPFGTQRYRVQFTASQEYVDLLEEARDLLAHAVPNRALDEVHLRALRLLVAELKKQKYALPHGPRSPRRREDDVCKPNGPDPQPAQVRREAGGEPAQVVSESKGARSESELVLAEQAAYRLDETMVARELAENHEGSPSNERSLSSERSGNPRQRRQRGRERERSASGERSVSSEQSPSNERSGNPRQRGRYVPAAVRRAVAERDRECCAYVDDEGRRCRETSGLELHHLKPHARGGPPTEANLSLRCRAHNGLAAESDFGREFMTEKKTRLAR